MTQKSLSNRRISVFLSINNSPETTMRAFSSRYRCIEIMYACFLYLCFWDPGFLARNVPYCQLGQSREKTFYWKIFLNFGFEFRKVRLVFCKNENSRQAKLGPVYTLYLRKRLSERISILRSPIILCINRKVAIRLVLVLWVPPRKTVR